MMQYIYHREFYQGEEVITPLLRTRNIKRLRSFLWRISFYPLFSIITYIALLVAQVSILAKLKTKKHKIDM